MLSNSTRGTSISEQAYSNLMSLEALNLIERIADRLEKIELRQTKIERKLMKKRHRLWKNHRHWLMKVWLIHLVKGRIVEERSLMKKTYKVLVNLKTVFFKYLGGKNAGATIKTIDFNGYLIFLTVSWLTQTLKVRH